MPHYCKTKENLNANYNSYKMTEKQEILDRMEQLRNAIGYSRDQQKIMSIGEGIMCNQEVAGWYRVLDSETSKPKYTVTTIIENKVREIEKIIEQTGWKKPIIF